MSMPPVIRVFCRFSMRQAPCHFSELLPALSIWYHGRVSNYTSIDFIQFARFKKLQRFVRSECQSHKLSTCYKFLRYNTDSFTTSPTESGLVCFRWLTYIMDETKRKLFTHIFSTFFIESLKKPGFMRLAEENFFLKNYLTSHFSPKNCKITTKNSYF